MDIPFEKWIFFYQKKFTEDKKIKENKNKLIIKTKGKKIRQAKVISWSHLYRGKAALIQQNKNKIKTTLILKRKKFGRKEIFSIGNHPPQKSITLINAQIIKLQYSPIKKNAKGAEEYSTE